MPEKYVYRVVKQDLSSADLELAAKTGEGYEILEIGVTGGASGSITQCIIGEELMLYFPSGNNEENVAPVPGVDTNTYTLFKTIRQKYPDVPTLKVSEGQTLTVSNGKVAGNAYVIYRHLTGGDVPPKDAPGASDNPTRLLIFHNKAEASIDAGATVTLEVDTSLSPSGFPDFASGDKVPSGYVYELLGFCTRLGAGSGADITYNGIRLWKGEEALLSPNQNFVNPDLFPYNTNNVNKPMFLLPKKIVFEPGESYKAEVQVTNSGSAAETAVVYLTLFVLRKPKA